MGISRAPLGGAKLPRLITEETALAGTDATQRMFSALRARQAARYAVDVVDARAGLPIAKARMMERSLSGMTGSTQSR